MGSFAKTPNQFDVSKIRVSNVPKKRQEKLKVIKPIIINHEPVFVSFLLLQKKLDRTLAKFFQQQREARDEEEARGFINPNTEGYHVTPEGVRN